MPTQLVGQCLVVDNGELAVGPRETCVKRADPGQVARERSRLHHDDTVELDPPGGFGASERQHAAALLPITWMLRSPPAGR